MAAKFTGQHHYELKSGMWIPRHGPKTFDYSDGDEVESRLRSIVEQAADKSLFSQELRDGITDWPSFYHLSAGRVNLLRPFKAQIANKTVLEIGSGCGAITRFLGEVGADVVALEGSYNRAGITRERTRDLANVQVVCDRIQDFSADIKFDIIVAIGVLEYARTTLTNVECPELEFIKCLRPMLKRNGVIILAIENQLGVKYFSGAKEDHIGHAFFGINDRYGKKTPVTFGRKVLSDLFSDAGLPNQQWYYPFPDYKVPMSIVSDAGLQKMPSLATALAAASVPVDPQRAEHPLFSLEAVSDVLSRNGLAGELANSFVVVACETDRGIQAFRDQKAVAWHYSSGSRHPAFLKEARFEILDDSIEVRRSALTNAALPPFPIRSHTVDETYVAGTNWWLELVGIVNKLHWSVDHVGTWCHFWLDQLSLALKADKIELVRESTMLLPGRYIDAVPYNLISTNQKNGRFIDQEWEIDRDIELGFLVYRSLLGSLTRISIVAEPEAATPIHIHDLIRAVAAKVGVQISDIDLRRFHDLELSFQEWAQGKAEEDRDPNLFEARSKATIFGRPVTEGIQNPATTEPEESALRGTLAEAEERVAALELQVKSRNQWIETADELRNLTLQIEERDTKLATADGDLLRLRAEVEDRDRRLGEAADELARSIVIAEKDRQALTGQIQEGDNRLRAAGAELRRLTDQVENLGQKLIAADADRQRLSLEIEDRDQKSIMADEELRRLTIDLENREQKLVSADEELRRLLDEVNVREQKFATAEVARRRLMGEVKDRDRKLAAADGGFRRLSAEIQRRDQQLVMADSSLRSLSAEIEGRDFRLRKSADEIRSLTAQLEERDQQRKALDQRLHAIETSTTWRMTASVRKLFPNGVRALFRWR